MHVYVYQHYIHIVLYKSSSVYQKPSVSSFDLDSVAQRGIALRRRILFLGILFGGKLVFSHSGWKGWSMRRGGYA